MVSNKMNSLPLFPLSRIVMPGGRLPLRIFEQRYMAMVRNCIKQNSGFGICLIAAGIGADPLARVYPYGTLVEITSWDSDESGLLMIVTQGVQKFRTINTALNPSGLLLGEVEVLPLAEKTAIPTQYTDLVELLRRAIMNVEPLVDYTESDFKDAAWVSNRLVEALPMPPEIRYGLMTIDNPIEQLDALQRFTNNWQP